MFVIVRDEKIRAVFDGCKIMGSATPSDQITAMKLRKIFRE